MRFRSANDAVLLAALLLLVALNLRGGEALDTNGPTLRLSGGTGEATTNSAADFMYFIPLISLEPVATLISPGNNQMVHMISSKRSASAHSFTVDCELELNGDGWQKNSLDINAAIRLKRERLEKNGSIEHQLKSIDVEGAGAITVQVKGSISNKVEIVNEVRLHFNAHGHVSPVWIHLCDIRRIHGDFQPTNEVVARVNALTFRRKAGAPKMDVTVASVKSKDAGNGFWQNFKGRIEGAAVNMFIPPLTVDAVGHEAMLNFGQALSLGSPTFTFPKATNLEKPKL